MGPIVSDDDDRWLDAIHEAQIEQVLDDNTASVHEWLEAKYHTQYQPGETEVCLEAVLACQEEKAPLPDWLVEALKQEIELALRRPVAWEALKLSAQAANQERRNVAERNGEWYRQHAQEILDENPRVGSVSRLAQLISKRAEGTEYAAAPRTIRRHLSKNPGQAL